MGYLLKNSSVFHKNKLLSVKIKDFDDWCKADKLMSKKTHLTSSGLEEIGKILTLMNKGREVS